MYIGNVCNEEMYKLYVHMCLGSIIYVCLFYISCVSMVFVLIERKNCVGLCKRKESPRHSGLAGGKPIQMD